MNTFKGQLAPTTQTGLLFTPTVSIDDNHEGHDYQPLVQKMHNILIALYMVTDLVENDDTVKDSLRETASSTLTQLYQVQYQSFHEHRQILQRSHALLSECSAYFDILFRIGYVSPMNYEVIMSEIHKLQGQLAELSSSLVGNELPARNTAYQLNIDKDFFNTSVTAGNTNVLTTEMDRYQSTDNHAHTKQEQQETVKQQTSLSSMKTSLQQNDDQPVFVKRQSVDELIERIKNKKTVLPKPTKIIPKPQIKPNRKPVVNEAKEERKQIILNVLKKNKNISITDICTHFVDCSTKTIQRDINELIDENKVVKQGSRRWSTYSLA